MGEREWIWGQHIENYVMYGAYLIMFGFFLSLFFFFFIRRPWWRDKYKMKEDSISAMYCIYHH